jgi:quercetin dioxygenase-like cupin family protein
MLTLRRTAVLATVGLLLVMATIALASPPSGQHTTPAVTGTLQPIDIEPNGIEFETEQPVEVTTFTLTLDPGGFTGWHTHPGVLIATVQSGAVIRQVGCDSQTYSVGQAFVEHGDQPTGQVKNASATQPAVFSVTQIAPPGTPRRTEDSPPSCPASGAQSRGPADADDDRGRDSD